MSKNASVMSLMFGKNLEWIHSLVIYRYSGKILCLTLVENM